MTFLDKGRINRKADVNVESKMKRCFWCSTEKIEIQFSRSAHSFPESIGGKFICPNVCNTCNGFFGETPSGSLQISIEETLKEIFCYSHSIFEQSIHRRKVSINAKIFKQDRKTGKLRLKGTATERLKREEELIEKFSRGMVKIALEEIHRQHGIGFDSKFDHLRDFARCRKGNPISIIYLSTPNLPIYMGNSDHPLICKYHPEQDIASVMIYFHLFIVPLSTSHHLQALTLKEIEENRVTKPVVVKKWSDLDLFLSKVDVDPFQSRIRISNVDSNNPICKHLGMDHMAIIDKDKT